MNVLGHCVSVSGIAPLVDQVQAIQDYSSPMSLRQLQRFLGLVNFYCRFLPHCAQITQPLCALLPKPKSSHTANKFVWTDEAAAAFKAVKDALAKATLLVHPNPDCPISVAVDASDLAVGAVLQQQVDGCWKPFAFFSRLLKPAETRYSTFGGELLAEYLAICHFRYYLEGCQFHLLTDHKPLTFALHVNSSTHSPSESRHLAYISEFTTDIRHICGLENSVADALSRPNEVHEITRSCHQCQSSKVQRPTSTPVGSFLPSKCRFGDKHLDLVGPLPSCQGYRYLLTCVDQYTRWPTVTPLRDCTAESVAQAFLFGWVNNHGDPLNIVTDRGGQFESAIFNQLLRFLGSHHVRPTSYHPASNGMVERLHCHSKAALKAPPI